MGAAIFTELPRGASVPIMNELPGVPVGPGVKTRLPPAYVATKLFVSVFNLSLKPVPIWSAALAKTALVSNANL